MNRIADLKLLPVWVDPNHLVSTAMHIMHGHRIKALAVLDGGRLKGTVSLEAIAAARPERAVSELVEPVDRVFPSSADVRSVAKAFVDEQLSEAPVMDGDKFLGLLTPLDLLRELGRSFDPLTGLSWSDRLREWGVDNLKSGIEVTIIFIDLDDFGLYNKRYGHIVGDRVLQKIAAFLEEKIDPEVDILVRYGGDEFAIGTLRVREEADDLMLSLTATREITVEGADEPVGLSLGIYGGRRTRERENTHYAATLDNLINMASRDCLANKRKRKDQATIKPTAALIEVVSESAPSPQAEYHVAGVYFDERSMSGVTTVILSNGDSVVSGAHSRAGKPALESISIATCKALERAIPNTQFVVDDIQMTQDGQSRMIAVRGRATTNGRELPVSGFTRIGNDLYESVAEATVAALLGGLGNGLQAVHSKN